MGLRSRISRCRKAPVLANSRADSRDPIKICDDDGREHAPARAAARTCAIGTSDRSGVRYNDGSASWNVCDFARCSYAFVNPNFGSRNDRGLCGSHAGRRFIHSSSPGTCKEPADCRSAFDCARVEQRQRIACEHFGDFFTGGQHDQAGRPV